MSKRRRLAIAALIGVALLASALAPWLLLTRDPISRATFNRIETGLSAAEVDEILGRKPDHVLTVGEVELERVWVGRRFTISVAFDENGLVVSRMSTPIGRDGEETILDRLQARLSR
jgi:hypothetical protein